MKNALITGVTGQDGSYLAEFLLKKGYEVIGLVRDVDRAKARLSSGLLSDVEIVQWRLQDGAGLMPILEKYQPDEFYNFAAHTSGIGMYENPVSMGEVNGLAVTQMLEAIRLVNPNIKFCQASSREVFGAAAESPQTESTPLNPRNPYGAAKLYADAMVRIFREHHGMFACSAILFNHESPRRGINFVTRKITTGAVRIKLGLANELHLGNLDAQRDWGFAGDYVKAMWLMLQRERADDYLLATGVAHSVRDFCELAFARLGLDYRAYVREDLSAFRPTESVLLVGSAAKAQRELEWAPEVNFEALVNMMVDADHASMGRQH